MFRFLQVFLIFSLICIPQTAQYSFTRVADDSETSPYFRIEEISGIFLNNKGEVLFSAPTKPDGIRKAIRAAGTQHTTIWDSAAAFRISDFNDAGEALLHFLQPFPGSLRVGSGGTLRLIADEGELDGISARLNNSGLVAFRSGFRVLSRLPGGALQTLLSDSELPRTDPSSRVQINLGGMNDSGTIVISGGRAASGIGTLLHTKGPDGLRRIPYESFGFVSPDINNRGELTWQVTEGSRSVIYKGSVMGVSQILRDDFDLELSVGSHPQINDRSETIYRARDRRSGIEGLYIHRGDQSVKVIAIGDSLFGSPISELSNLGGSLGKVLNDNGQIAFYYRNRESRGIALASPAAAPIQLPAIAPAGILNAASFQNLISPGAIASLFGQNFASTLTVGSGAPLPSELDRVRVTFNGIPAPLFFTSQNQVNVQVPYELTGTTAEVRVSNSNGSSESQRVNLAIHSPSLFTLAQSGRGQAIAVLADTATIVAPIGTTSDSRPARPGEIITLYGTGFGPVTPPIETGTNSCSASRCLPDLSNLLIRRCVVNPVITIAGTRLADQDLLFCGLAPQLVGLYQLNIRIPSGVAPGNAQPVIITQGANTSPPDVHIAIR
jgi:uncharacterized protein (TIGR03437 family)